MRWLLIAILLLCCAAATAQDTLSYERTVSRDSIVSTRRNDRLFDTIAARASRRALPRLLYNALFSSRRTTLPSAQTRVENAVSPFRPYQGQHIARVEITPLGLLAGSDSTWIERLGAAFHVTTRLATIRRDLLFHEGDALDAELIVSSQQRLQARPYLTDVRIVVEPLEDSLQGVLVRVFTQDNWSIGATGGIRGNGRTTLAPYDANFLGHGIRLSVAEHLNWRDWSHGGLMVSAHQPNTLGSRFETTLAVGKAFDDSNLGIAIQKEFLTPTDYAGGIDLQRSATSTYLLYADSSVQIRSGHVEAWAGGSIYLRAIRSSLYGAARYSWMRFDGRPADTGPRFNPAFHDRKLALASIGLYRERFYTSNLIYGYGHREYLATGYRIEAVGGYSDGEFEEQWYGALSYRLGKFVGWGYLTGSAEAGSFFDNERSEWGRGAFKLQSHYFSNLWQVGARTRMRQFVTLTLLHGWNRYGGAQEAVGFLDQYKLRGLDEWIAGTNRASLSLENVLFTSWQPLGFRMALFAFADMGTLGERNNLFDNPFYATVGAGVRFKNERLIFNGLELRFGLAVSGRGLLPAQYVALTAQPQVVPTRFRPEIPSVIAYR